MTDKRKRKYGLDVQIASYVEDNMLGVLSGSEAMEDFIDPQKWMSSNYHMPIPGTHKAKVVREHEVDVVSFSMLRTPGTNERYNAVMGTTDYHAAIFLP